MTIKNINVRFFAYYINEDNDELELTEINESEFLIDVESGSKIEYERHTVRKNGVSQICLTAIRP